MIREVKVIMTIFVKESRNMKSPNIKIVVPWNIDLKSQTINVLRFIALPFCSVLYNGG